MATYSGNVWALKVYNTTHTNNTSPSYQTIYTCPADTIAIIGGIKLYGNTNSYEHYVKRYFMWDTGLIEASSGTLEMWLPDTPSGYIKNTAGLDARFQSWVTEDYSSSGGSKAEVRIKHPDNIAELKAWDFFRPSEYIKVAGVRQSSTGSSYSTIAVWERSLTYSNNS